MKWWYWFVLLPKLVWGYFRIRKYFQTKSIQMAATFPVQQNAFGIDESRKVVRIIGTVVKAVLTADGDGDGKISGNEIFKQASDVIYTTIQNFPNVTGIRNEAHDYIEQEKAVLAGELAAEIGIPVAKATHLVEAGAKIVLDIFDFVVDAKKPHSEFEPKL